MSWVATTHKKVLGGVELEVQRCDSYSGWKWTSEFAGIFDGGRADSLNSAMADAEKSAIEMLRRRLAGYEAYSKETRDALASAEADLGHPADRASTR